MATTNGLGRTLMTSFANSAFNNTAFISLPANLFISLHTADPGEDGQTSNEVSTSGTAYARQSVTTTGGFTIALTGGVYPITIKNTSTITYATATAGFGTVTYFAIWNNVSATAAANFWGRGTVPSQVISAGNTASFAAAALVCNITGT